MTNDLETIQAGLQSSYGVQVPSDWLDACIEWIQQENGGQQMSVAELQPMVFEQWLMSDLRELGAACLPADLPVQASTHITGPFALQVDSMVDVGFPMYGQLQKVKGTTNANTEVSADKPQQPAWEPKASRMMLMKMTDGQTEVQGMEYRPIPTITANLQPGFKVVVHGQVKCRRGVLMLTADNLQVLGGEVDSLVETNTPVTVLQQAMEASTANNGQSARQQFSGRFINQQDFNQGGCGDGKGRSKMTSSWHKPAPYGMSTVQRTSNTAGQGFGNGCGGGGMVKAAPSTKQTAFDDEWEEDLDYGGILNTFDEPMDDDMDVKPDVKPCTSVAMQSTSSSTAERNRKPSLPIVKHEPRDKALETVTAVGDNKVKMPSHSRSLKQNGGTDEMWGDDDDFDIAHAENEWMSPVIPVQSGFGDAQKSTATVSSSSTLPHAGKVDVSKPCNVKKEGSGAKADVSSSVFSADMKLVSKTPLFNKTLPQRPAKVSSSHNTSAETKPPPAKQRKLTSMLTTRKREMNSVTSEACSQNGSHDVVDLTDGDSAAHSHTASQEYRHAAENRSAEENRCVKVKQEVWSMAENGKEYTHPQIFKNTVEEKTEACSMVQQTKTNRGIAMCRAVENLPSTVKTEHQEDIEMVEQSGGSDSSQRALGVLSADVPKAVISPFTKQGQPLPPTHDHQCLKDVQSWLQTSTHGQNTFTIKGYITTLTDRLRSGKGDCWSLSCRITDGTATLEVAIADTVLSHLIGFSAKDSIALRQQAREDPKMKEFLSQGLQKCQKALIEFSGLMDLQAAAGNLKPSIINMIQLEKKQR